MRVWLACSRKSCQKAIRNECPTTATSRRPKVHVRVMTRIHVSPLTWHRRMARSALPCEEEVDVGDVAGDVVSIVIGLVTSSVVDSVCECSHHRTHAGSANQSTTVDRGVGGLSPACQWGSQSTCRGRIRSAQMLAAMAAKRSSLHVSGLHTGSLSGTCTRRRCLLQCEQ